MGLNDALAAPMADVFDPKQPADWTFTARVPAVLRTTQLPLPPRHRRRGRVPRRAAALAGLLGARRWRGRTSARKTTSTPPASTARSGAACAATRPIPRRRDGRDLRAGRAALLAGAGVAGCGETAPVAAGARSLISPGDR